MNFLYLERFGADEIKIFESKGLLDDFPKGYETDHCIPG